MNFKQIQDAVLSGAFDESLRGQSKDWINHRLQQLWAAESWSFTFQAVSVSVVSGSMVLQGVPGDVNQVDSLQDSDGEELMALEDPRDYYRRYVNTTAVAGKPEAFTVINDQILVGPVSNVTDAAYTLVYEQQVTLLDQDGDIPAFPAGYHYALVHGGKAEGFYARSMILFASSFENLFQQSIDAMRDDLIDTVRDPGQAWSGRYVPEQPLQGRW